MATAVQGVPVTLRADERERLEQIEREVVMLRDAVNELVLRAPKRSWLSRQLTDGKVIVGLIALGGSTFVSGWDLYNQARDDHKAVEYIQQQHARSVRNDTRILLAFSQFCAQASVLWAKRGETIICPTPVLSTEDDRPTDRPLR